MSGPSDTSPMLSTMLTVPAAQARPLLSEPAEARVILAAVEIQGDAMAEGHARGVLRAAARLSELNGGELHVLFAWTLTGETILSCPLRGVSRARLTELLRSAQRAWETRMEAFCAETLGRRAARIHVVHGDSRFAIPALSSRLGAALVVMGMPERMGWLNAFGRTCVHYIAGRIGCDLLAIRRSSDNSSLFAP